MTNLIHEKAVDTDFPIFLIHQNVFNLLITSDVKNYFIIKML